MRSFVAIVSLFSVASAVSAEEILREFSWSSLKQERLVEAGELIPADGQTPFGHLRVGNVGKHSQNITILTVDDPGITNSVYAVHGMVRYEDVEGDGYMEMWSYFPEGRYFSRTLSPQGPSKKLHGSSGWRRFLLPFDILDASKPRPHRLQINVVLPGRGTVYVGPLSLTQYADGEEPLGVTGAWWSGSMAGLGGGIVGSMLGCMGGLIGWLAYKDKRRALVLVLMKAMVGLGVVTLVVGAAALALGQPYAVYFPLLLIGAIFTPGFGLQIRGLRKRDEQIELRKMDALDAS